MHLRGEANPTLIQWKKINSIVILKDMGGARENMHIPEDS